MERKDIIKALEDIVTKLPNNNDGNITKSMLCSVMASLEGGFGLAMAAAMIAVTSAVLKKIDEDRGSGTLQ